MRSTTSRIDLTLWVAAGVCVAVTLWLSLVTVPPGNKVFHDADKLEHALAYLVTTLLVLFAAVWRPGGGEGPLARWWWAVLGVMVVAGGLVELVQASIGRDAELGDWIAEIAAVALAWGIFVVVRRSSEHA